MGKTTILIADDHAIVRHGLSALLATEPDFEVIGVAENGQQAVEMAEKLRPDVVIMDLAMPLLSGIDATRHILKASRNTKVLVLSTYSNEEAVMEAIQAGASGFLTKANASTDLVNSVRGVRKGICIPQDIMRRLKVIGFDPLNPGEPQATKQTLTTREAEVLQAIADGLPNKAIAAQLGISIKTVEKHRQRLMNKLNIHETAGLTRYAIGHGIIDPQKTPTTH